MKVKRKKIQLIHQEPGSECIEILKSAIVEDKILKSYIIDNHTLIKNLPEGVINAFLDFLSPFQDRHRSIILEEIKKGKLTLECKDV